MDYRFWNGPEVTARRAEVISAAVAYDGDDVEKPVLECAVILFNEMVTQVRQRLGHNKNQPDGRNTSSEEQRRIVRSRYMEAVSSTPPQTAFLLNVRIRLLEAVRDLEKPLGKWEREFILNASCTRYEVAAMTARGESGRKNVHGEGSSRRDYEYGNFSLNADG